MPGTNHNIAITVTALDQGGNRILRQVQDNFAGVQRAAQRAGGVLVQTNQQVTNTARNTERSTQGMQMAFSKIALGIGAATTAAYAMKKGFEFAEQGAQLELVEIQAQRMAETIGTSWDALKADIDTATKGLMSSAEITAGALDLMKLGLATTHEEAVRLTRVAGLLDMNMNQLVLTLTNKTTMRFDALGLSVDGFKEKVKALEEAGYDADEAFKLAFIEQAEQKVEQLGDVAGTAAGEFKKFKANIDDAGTSLKMFWTDALLPVIKGINDTIEVRKALNRAEQLGIISAHEQEAIYLKLKYGLIDLEEVFKYLTQAEIEFMDGAEGADRAMLQLDDSVKRVTDSVKTLGDELTGVARVEWDQLMRAQGEMWEQMRDPETLAGLDDLFMTDQEKLERDKQQWEDYLDSLRQSWDESMSKMDVFGTNRWETDSNFMDDLTATLFEQVSATQHLNEANTEYLRLLELVSPETVKQMEASALLQQVYGEMDAALKSGSASGREMWEVFDNLRDAMLANVEPAKALKQALTEIWFETGGGIAALNELVGVSNDLVDTRGNEIFKDLEEDLYGAEGAAKSLSESLGTIDDNTAAIETVNSTFETLDPLAAAVDTSFAGIADTLTSNSEAMTTAITDLHTAMSTLNTESLSTALKDMTAFAALFSEESKNLMVLAVNAVAHAFRTTLNPEIKFAANTASSLKSTLDSIDGMDVHAYVTVHISEVGGGSGHIPGVGGFEGTVRPSTTGGAAAGFGATPNVIGNSGLDFFVPPGYPNDSYTVGVESGEHVRVTPAHEVNQMRNQGGSGRPVTFNFKETAMTPAQLNQALKLSRMV